MKTSSYLSSSITLRYFIALTVTLCISFATATAENLDSIMSVLTREVNALPQYTRSKEDRLSALKAAYRESDNNSSAFNTAKELFDEYIYYQSDSAYSYAARMTSHARALKDDSKLASAYFAFMKCFSSNGFFKEAGDMMQIIDPTLLPHDELLDYLRTSGTFYQNLESYAGGAGTDLGKIYREKRLGYARQLSALADSNSYLWQQNEVNLSLMENPSLSNEISQRTNILRRFNLDDHEKAIQYSLLGHAYLASGDRDAAKYNLALSAIHDIKGSIHETTAAKMLAELMYEDNDNLNTAHTLVHRAFDDATFYNSHLRRDELSRTMQLIDSARFKWRSNQFWLSVAALIVFLLLSGVILWLFVKMRHRNRLIEKVNQELQDKSADLIDTRLKVESINKELEKTISQLKEVSEIKDQYITQSLYLNTVFVNQVEDRCKNVPKLLREKKYDELKYLPYQLGIKEERQRIFRSFDNAFLQLFPNFIDEFNRLFNEEDWVSLDNGELPMELRIFALLRLGITDPAEVGRYLNLSTKTIYVYKTKIKSRSTVDNNDFEALIMAIPKP